MSFFSRGNNRGGNGGNRGRRGRGPNTFWQPRGHKKLRFSIHFDVDSDEFQEVIQTGHLNLGGQQALPQPQATPNVILQPHPGIVNIPESLAQPHVDGWGNLPANPSSRANQWPMPPPPPPIHIFVSSASIPLPPIHPVLHVHTTATHESMPPPPPPKDHKTTPHCSQIDKGKQPITSTSMAKSSSSTHSNIKSAGSGKRSLHEEHPEIASWKRRSPNMRILLKKEMSFSGRSFLNYFNHVLD
jgi:hypothetical protein